ncbi:MAG: acyltransferase family protein [Sphingomonadaceae bacterium]
MKLDSHARLIHMDALRAFCMLFGIMVHAATIADNPFFTFVKDASNLFRMATFMLISGFFTALVATRSADISTYYRGRMRVLVFPLVSTLLLLNPVTTWLIHIWHNNFMGFGEWLGGGWRSPTRGNDVWHLHLWFLFSLIAYALVTPALLLLFRRPFMSRTLDHYCDLTSGWTAWANVALVAVGVAGCRLIHDKLTGPLSADTPFGWIESATLTYFSYFVLGLLAFLNRRLFASLHIWSWTGLILFTGLYLMTRHVDLGLPRAPERMLYWIAGSGLTMFIICALMYVFQRWVNKPGAVLRFLVDGSYTFYLVHMTVIYLLAHLFTGITNNVYVIYGLLILVGTPVCFAIHHYLIAPVPLLRWMFNGKRTPGSGRAPASTS